jgi:hypothetical protein
VMIVDITPVALMRSSVPMLKKFAGSTHRAAGGMMLVAAADDTSAAPAVGAKASVCYQL